MEHQLTRLGRVQPLFEGPYDANRIYHKLDNVSYDGSTWACIASSSIQGIEPAEGSYWTLVASKGETGPQGNTGSFGAPTAIATRLEANEVPTVSISATGPDNNKIFNFQFGIPAGHVGVNNAIASAASIAANLNATASASIIENNDERILSLYFGIPVASGANVQEVDGVLPSAGGNVILKAVSYGSQSLSTADQTIARNNINAQVVGDYIEVPTGISTDQFVQYNGSSWIGHDINEVPVGNVSSDDGKYLRFINNGMTWAQVYSIPSGGNAGTPLIKHSNNDYDVEWGSAIPATVNSKGLDSGTTNITVYASDIPISSSNNTPISENFPTSGTPANPGTASNGTALTFAHSDHVHQRQTDKDIFDTNWAAASSSYPTSAGIWAVTGAIFSNFSPPASFGELVIEKVGGYQRHSFTALTPFSNSNNRTYIGITNGSSIVEPSAWMEIGSRVRTASIALGSSWPAETNGWYQSIAAGAVTPSTIVTANSKIDLQPDNATILQLVEDGVIALYISNDNGALTAHAIGAAPTSTLNIQCTLTEVQ